MLLIENQGQAVKSTNYWDSEHARAGYIAKLTGRGDAPKI